MNNNERLKRFELGLPTLDNVAIPFDVGLTEGSHPLAQWLATEFNHNFNEYDRAIDSVYNSIHVGGSQYHHILDGQHSFLGALKAAHNANVDDSFLRELVGASEHLLRDTASVSGINPFFSLNPEQFNQLANLTQNIGVSKPFLADALTVNGPEVIGGTIALAASLLLSKEPDPSKLSTISGAYITSALASANPLLLPVAAGGLVYSFYKSKDKKEAIIKAGKGSFVSGSALLVSGLVGGPAWLGCIIAMGTAVVVRCSIDRPCKAFERVSNLIKPANDVLRKAILISP